MAKAEIDLLDSISAGAKLLKTNPTCREILRWTLGRCEGSWVELSTLEAEIVELPEYNEACPEPFFVMQWLVDAGCLESIDVDESGSPVDRAAMIESGATDLSNDRSWQRNRCVVRSVRTACCPCFRASGSARSHS